MSTKAVSGFPGMYQQDVVFFESGRRTQTTLYWANREELLDLIQEMQDPMTRKLTGWSAEDTDLLIRRLALKLETTPWEVDRKKGSSGARGK